MLANIHRDPKKRGKPFEPADFMPRWDAATAEKPDPMDPKLMRAKLHAAFGGKVRRTASAPATPKAG